MEVPTTETPPKKRREFHEFSNNVAGRSWMIKADAVAFLASGAWDNPLMLLSAVGDGTSIKAMSAMLHGNERINFRCRHLGYHNQIGRSPEGYDIARHPIGLGNYHMLAVSRSSDLLLTVNTESLWSRLRSDAYTTPVLRSWMPWLLKQLREHKLLIELSCFGCSPGLLKLSESALDNLVSDGIKSGDLKIE